VPKTVTVLSAEAMAMRFDRIRLDDAARRLRI
jgi:hypothetical protein